MPVEENYIEYNSSRLYYVKSGNGSIPLLIFHGFGQDHRSFVPWIDALGKKYGLYIFDIYFHGQSTWPARTPLEKADWTKILGKFLEKEQIKTFEIVGFSLGGKFVLASVESFHERITRVVLLAPDGIKTLFWYSLATYPFAIRIFFKTMILKPGRFYTLVKALRRMGLVNKGMLRFAESQMDTEEKRRRVYFTWVYFRHFQFDISQIASLLNQSRIPLLMIAGKYDKVIPVKNMNLLLRRLDSKRLEIIETGHNDLIKLAVKFMV